VRTWDTFLFGDELEMLRCRLEELDGKVHRHVLVESALDHQGNAKPLYYAENKSQFSAFNDRIVHVVADLPTYAETREPWDREHAQREAVRQGLEDASPDDVVLLCDVDEIPSDRALRFEPGEFTALNMRIGQFAVDWVWPEESRIAVMARHKHLVKVPLWLARNNGPRGGMPLLGGAGWHFTWLGGPEAIKLKAEQFCHLELQGMILQGNEDGWWYEQGRTWHGSDAYPPPPTGWLAPVTVDETWPAYIYERRCPPSWFRPTD
jgi:hypothetical protein